MKDFNTKNKAVHIYQNTRNGFLLFYTALDMLVFFTIYCISAHKHKIRVLGVCPMMDHLHSAVEAANRQTVSRFVQDYTQRYSRELNKSIDDLGPVFNKGFGCALRKGTKAVRTLLSYVYNNPGEKGLCNRAEEYRWTFLAYAVSNHPFSEKIVLSKASAALRKSLKMVDYHFKEGHYLKHSMLDDWFKPLTVKEKNQLTDYIISTYNVIDYQALISYYGDYQSMCTAFASNQGSEYEIKEEFVPGSYKVFLKISSVLREVFGFSNIKDVIRSSAYDRSNLFLPLVIASDAKDRQVSKYLRIKLATEGVMDMTTAMQAVENVEDA